jgi:hypothetical protein
VTDRLIYAALVAVWMAYLIPMGIRRYREVSAQGSIESFSSTMLALGRRPSASTAPGGTPPGRTIAARPAQPEPAASGVLDRPSARQAAARRRRTLLVLLGLVVVTGVLVVLTSLLWPAVLVPIALVVAFLVVCHIQVARLEEAAWRRAAEEAKRTAVSTRSAAPVSFGGDEEDTLVISGPAAARLASVLTEVAPSSTRPAAVIHGATAASAPQAQPVTPAEHGAQPVSRTPQPAAVAAANGSSPAPAVAMQPAASLESAPAPQPVAASIATDHVASPASRVGSVNGAHPAPAPLEQPAAPATWDLRPATLPTYITKSRAPHTVRSVDRTGSGTWSSGRTDAARAVRKEPSDKPVEQRRAVGG